MGERTQRALEIFKRKEGNCSQAVLAAFGSDLDVPQAQCFHLAACFGAGMGRLGKTCGALTGGLMVLGLRHGHEMTTDPQRGRDTVYARVQKLMARFEEKLGSTECRALIGCDMTTPEGREEFVARDLHNTLCANAVATVASLLEEPEFIDPVR